MLERLIYAGVHHSSFARASDALRRLADLPIAAKQVERLTQRIGAERCVERDAAVAAYQALPLTARKSAPAGVVEPDLAVVEVDGGRLQVLDRDAAEAVPPSEAAASAGHWREDKIGLLATMTSTVSEVDPCPTIPESFVDPLRIVKLAQEIKGSMGVGAAAAAREEATPEPAGPAATYTAPKLQQRSVSATLQDVYEFGPMLAQAAWTRGFFAAKRRAFVADGSSANWGVWERHFSNFTPIVDFIHALSYVFQAAMAGRSFALGWAAYTEWIQALWAGQVEQVLAALTQRQVDLGAPTAEEAETSPRSRVAEALTYLQNQKERMRYDAFRQQGLPITSSHIESTIKQINQRVKGTEKFWSSAGAEAILQLRADALSETAPLNGFWQRRQAAATGQRRYKAVA